MPPDNVINFDPLSNREPGKVGTGGSNAGTKAPIVPVPSDAPPMRFSHPVYGCPKTQWEYRLDTGELAGYACRFDFVNKDGRPDKVVLPITYCDLGDGKRGWRAAGIPPQRPLYRLIEIASRRVTTIIVCEGEKAADAAAVRFPDHVATTPMHGAKSPNKTDWGPVAGRQVIIWPDHDTVGADFAQAVAALATQAGAASVAIVDVPADWPEKWDLADPLPETESPETLQALLESASVWQPSAPRHQNAPMAPMTTLEPGIIPPAWGIDDISAFIGRMTRNMGAKTKCEMIDTALYHIARLQAGPVVGKELLQHIKQRTGIGVADLSKELRAARAGLGKNTKTAPDQGLDAILRRYVYVMAVGAFWDRKGRAVVAIENVRYAHWAEMPQDDDGYPLDPRDVLLKGVCGKIVDRVDGMSFMPGAPEIFDEDRVPVLNIWVPPEIVAIAGDASPFTDHISYILDGDIDAVAYVLDFLAHLVQRPEIKIKAALLIIGKVGIGKSLIGDMMARLLGRQNTTAVEESNLRSSFNEWMDGVQLVLVNELMTLDRQETMNRLKSYITDPWLRINRKHVSPYSYRNRANFLMFSNHEDAAKIEKGDRRYFVWISGAEKRADQYYTELMNWFGEGGGAAAILHFLHARDLSAFNPNAAPPLTPSKATVIEHSRTDTEAYLLGLFEAEQAPFQHDLVVVTDVIEYLWEIKRMRVSPRQVAKVLHEVGAVKLGQVRIAERGRPTLWALRDIDPIYAVRDAARWLKVPDRTLAQLYRSPNVPPMLDIERRAIRLDSFPRGN